MDSSRMDTWIADARQKLGEAQSICNSANDYIELTTSKLASKEDRLPKLMYYLDACRQQLRLLGVVRDSLDLSINKLFDGKRTTEMRLGKKLAALQKTVGTLKGVTVDSSFNGEEHSLFYYISEDDLNDLMQRVHTTVNQVDRLMKNSRTDALLIRLGFDLDNFNNEFHTLETMAETKLGGERDPVGKLLKINEELELDMVSILQSFNRHYDQCIEGSKVLVDPRSSLTDKEELYGILEDDVLELPSALTMLQNDKDTVVKNSKEIIKTVGIFQEFYERVEKFIKDLSEYGEMQLQKQLEEFGSVENGLAEQIGQLESLSTTVVDYNKDFQQFVEAYYSLVLEVNRRQETNRKLNNLVEKFKLSLCEVINEEYDQRLEFMQLHGDFLPQNLVDPKVVNAPPPQVDINMSTEELPGLHQESVAAALKNIR